MSAPTELLANAREATSFLKAISNEHRLMILCLIADGEQTVSEIEAALGLRQSTPSQHLGRLREDGLVVARREGKSVHYRLASDDVREIVNLLHRMFCR
jgi:DNA-binding transcriptional ArsR family regulator